MNDLVDNIEDCHRYIRSYHRELQLGADDKDPEKRDSDTADRYGQDLRWYQAWLNENGLEPDEVDRKAAKDVGFTLSETYHGSTAQDRWNRIENMYNNLRLEGTIEENPFAVWGDPEIKREKFGFSNTPQQEKELESGEDYAVTQEDVRALEEAASKPRDKLLIRLLWQTGLRRGEVANLKISSAQAGHEVEDENDTSYTDVDLEKREITVRDRHAKNDSARVVPYQPSLDGLLKDWINHHRKIYRDWRESNYLFITERSTWMRPDTIREIVLDLAKETGINRELYDDAKNKGRNKITPHNLRHGYGSYLVNETDASIYEASKLLGHKSVKQTEETYVEEDPRAGVETGREFGPD